MDELKRIQEEVDRNFDFFKRELPRLIQAHRGQFALLRDAAVVEYFDTFWDADKYAEKVFPDLIYSIQEVDDTAADLGSIGMFMYA